MAAATIVALQAYRAVLDFKTTPIAWHCGVIPWYGTVVLLKGV